MSNGATYPPASLPLEPPAPSVASWKQFPAMTASTSVWQPDTKVQYAVAFLNSWETNQAVSGPYCAEVTVPADSGCPLLNVPIDTTSPCPATARQIYRIIGDGPAVLVKTILDNTTKTVYDDDPRYNFSAAAIEVGAFTARSNVPYIAAWAPGNKVSYTITFTFAPQNSTWEVESMPSASTAPITVGAYAQPQLLNIPVFPSGGDLPICTGRNIYRTTYSPDGSTLIEDSVLIASIPGNNPVEYVVDLGPQLLGSTSLEAQPAPKAARSAMA